MNGWGTAPICWSTTCPPLKTSSVGIERTPKACATSGFSSMLSLATFARPAYAVARASIAGPIMRHGAHHSAQKSTSTGTSASVTSCFQLSFERTTTSLFTSSPPLG